MNAQEPGSWDRGAAHPWGATAIGFVLLYCLLLVFVFVRVSFSEEDVALNYFAQIANRPPAQLPPVPFVHAMEWPDIAMRRDPFQSLAVSTKHASSEPQWSGAASDTPTAGPFRLVASYRDLGQPYVVGRGSTDDLARFRVGDEVDGGVIEHIDSDRVILNSGGQQHVVEFLRVATAPRSYR